VDSAWSTPHPHTHTHTLNRKFLYAICIQKHSASIPRIEIKIAGSNTCKEISNAEEYYIKKGVMVLLEPTR
jgi:hypothetical protein